MLTSVTLLPSSTGKRTQNLELDKPTIDTYNTADGAIYKRFQGTPARIFLRKLQIAQKTKPFTPYWPLPRNLFSEAHGSFDNLAVTLLIYFLSREKYTYGFNKEVAGHLRKPQN